MNGQVIEGRLARCICAWSKRPLILSLLLMATLAEGTSQTRDWANFHVGGLRPLQSRLRDAKRLYPQLQLFGKRLPSAPKDAFVAELEDCTIFISSSSDMVDNSPIEVISLKRKSTGANPCPSMKFGGTFGLGSSWREVVSRYPFLKINHSMDTITLRYDDLSNCTEAGIGTIKGVYIEVNKTDEFIRYVELDNSKLSCQDYRASELDEKNNQKN